MGRKNFDENAKSRNRERGGGDFDVAFRRNKPKTKPKDKEYNSRNIDYNSEWVPDDVEDLIK